MEVITEIKKAVNVAAIGNLKKMSVGRNHYRIRVGDYRLGVEIAGDTLIFVRCLHRRDIYRSFP